MGVVFTDKSEAYLRRLTSAIEDQGGALDAATQFAADKSARSMPGAGANVFPGTGGDTGVRARYIPSSPGQPPGVRTNRLRGSLTNARIGTLRWAFGTNVEYARAQEFGTSKMPARPFLRPVINMHRAAIGRVFNARLKSKMGGGA